ncbi:MAG: lipoate--protein ligase [Clostridia bacterium]|nr:lipoate--protein ligase [Clostridia bacterium]
MKLLINKFTDPEFNLALEEYALTQLRQEMIILWQNSASVIIGKNQNAIEEIDIDYIRNNDIKVIRRQSGGGAVFHDLGNINFTVIGRIGSNDFNNYEKFTAPICTFLQSLGVDAKLEGRNDLVINGLKFSGNAQAVKNGWIMHHGTLLFNADLSHLAKALKPKPAKIESKGIKSIRNRVTNISSHLPYPIEVEDFFEKLASYIRENSTDLEDYELTEEDVFSVNQLVQCKYGTWAWNIGKSPEYNYTKSTLFSSGRIDIYLKVRNGSIEEATIYGDFFSVLDKSELEQKITGIRHDKELIKRSLEDVCLQDYIHGITMGEFLDLF